MHERQKNLISAVMKIVYLHVDKKLQWEIICTLLWCIGGVEIPELGSPRHYMSISCGHGFPNMFSLSQ